MSRPRSTPSKAAPTKAVAGKKTTRPAGRPGVYVATPKSDIYVALLGVSLGAMVIATLLLTLILNGYEFQLKA